MKYDYYKFVPEWDSDRVFPYYLYEEAAKKCSDGDILCEVNNAFFGRTASFMAECLAENNKKAKFYVFDMFNDIKNYLDGDKLEGKTPWNEDVNEWLARIGGWQKSIELFDFCFSQNPFSSHLTGRAQFNSWQVADEFDNESVFFCLIRLTKSEIHTKNCLDFWYPKIRNGGSLVLYQTRDKSYNIDTLLPEHETAVAFENFLVIEK